MKALLPHELRQVNGGYIFDFGNLLSITIDGNPFVDPGPDSPVVDNPIGPVKVLKKRVQGFIATTI